MRTHGIVSPEGSVERCQCRRGACCERCRICRSRASNVASLRARSSLLGSRDRISHARLGMRAHKPRNSTLSVRIILFCALALGMFDTRRMRRRRRDACKIRSRRRCAALATAVRHPCLHGLRGRPSRRARYSAACISARVFDATARCRIAWSRIESSATAAAGPASSGRGRSCIAQVHALLGAPVPGIPLAPPPCPHCASAHLSSIRAGTGLTPAHICASLPHSASYVRVLFCISPVRD